MITPCKDCNDRCVGCHSNCDRYKEFREVVDKRNNQKREYRKKQDVLIGYTRESIRRNNKIK